MRVSLKAQPISVSRRLVGAGPMLLVIFFVAHVSGAPTTPVQPEGSTFSGPLNAAAEVLHRAFHVEVDVAWQALAEAGVNDNTQVKEMSRKSLDDALRAILHASGANTCTVATPGHILLTTRKALAQPVHPPRQAETDRPAELAASHEAPAELDVANESDEPLDQHVDELRLDGLTFEDAVIVLADAAHANIVVHWHDLQEAGVKRTQLIRLHLWNVSVRAALRAIFAIVDDGSSERMAFEVEGNIIHIGTPEGLQHAVTRLYDINDLLEKGAETVRRHATDASEEESRQVIVDTLIKILTDTIAPDSWRDAGGSLGAVRELMGNLVVTQSRENQRQVKEILAELREMEKLPQPENH